MELQRRQRNFVAVEEGVGIDEVAVAHVQRLVGVLRADVNRHVRILRMQLAKCTRVIEVRVRQQNQARRQTAFFQAVENALRLRAGVYERARAGCVLKDHVAVGLQRSQRQSDNIHMEFLSDFKN